MAGENGSAKKLRETEKKNAAANKKGPKSEIAAGKGQEKSGLKKPIRQPKLAGKKKG